MNCFCSSPGLLVQPPSGTPAWSCSLFVILSPVRRRETKSLPRSRF
ncbi:hypothetical protein V2J09_016153 [Rumex salicifolius]